MPEDAKNAWEDDMASVRSRRSLRSLRNWQKLHGDSGKIPKNTFWDMSSQCSVNFDGASVVSESFSPGFDTTLNQAWESQANTCPEPEPCPLGDQHATEGQVTSEDLLSVCPQQEDQDQEQEQEQTQEKEQEDGNNKKRKRKKHQTTLKKGIREKLCKKKQAYETEHEHGSDKKKSKAVTNAKLGRPPKYKVRKAGYARRVDTINELTAQNALLKAHVDGLTACLSATGRGAETNTSQAFEILIKERDAELIFLKTQVAEQVKSFKHMENGLRKEVAELSAKLEHISTTMPLPSMQGMVALQSDTARDVARQNFDILLAMIKQQQDHVLSQMRRLL